MEKRADLVLCWHMHQPDYRDHATGEFTQPWVYLHAIKDYADMAAHLERHPGVAAVVNLVPILLDQLEDYADQFATGKLRDPLLRLLARDESTPLARDERRLVVERCFHANHEKMVQPFPAYEGLHDLFLALERQGRDPIDYLSDRYCYDLVTWYHLAWTGETVKRGSELVTRLMSIGMGFSETDRRELLALIGAIVAGTIPRYARLATNGRIELSTTPHHHPLAPLLIDFQSARETHPQLPLPTGGAYPGGAERVLAHLDAALASHARRFGAAPAGIWPAEGAVSAPLLGLLAERGCRWTASSESVLANSLRAGGEPVPERPHYVYRPWRTAGTTLACFFRDDRLSDLIGFEYSKWHGAEAAAHFVAELEAIAADATGDETPLVSVILDGENCWEFYPYNGFYFLDSLYGKLESHSFLRTMTFADTLRPPKDAGRPRAAAGELPRVTAGSWVHGDLATWIGSREKNHAWELLIAAKQSFDLVAGSGRLAAAQLSTAERQLANCEGSDWFWWMGDYNPAFAVASFDALYRANLARLYRLLELPVPPSLGQPISRGTGHPELGGTMRRASRRE
jgi:alpha-amylase/alpha-mannosidase (GH57 family)